MAPLDVDSLTRVGPGTPTGEFFREFWIPAAISTEVTPDGNPLRLMLLGEKLIAFRDTSGRVGVMDHRCAHRCASLFFGRNENNGIRCAYHGWKYDVTGACVDMPNVLPEHAFPKRIKLNSYAVRERNGVIWVYMGTRKEPPPLPNIAIVADGFENLVVDMVMREANWLQSYEGDIDPSHLGFLHHGNHRPSDVKDDFIGQWLTTDPRVRTKVVDTDWGTMEGHVRPYGSSPNYWHYSQYLFPFWSMPGQDRMDVEYPIVRAWVPMDDTHSMCVQFMLPSGLTAGGQPKFFDKALSRLPGVAKRAREFLLPNTTDWFGRWRVSPAAENDYFINRDVQREASFSGIEGIQIQDKAIVESMGPIVDRTHEHLTVADLMVVRTRRRLLAAVLAREENGSLPAVLDRPELNLPAYACGIEGSGEHEDWLSLYAGKVQELGRPAPRLKAETVAD